MLIIRNLNLISVQSWTYMYLPQCMVLVNSLFKSKLTILASLSSDEGGEEDGA